MTYPLEYIMNIDNNKKNLCYYDKYSYQDWLPRLKQSTSNGNNDNNLF
jgi:hypothetical protein